MITEETRKKLSEARKKFYLNGGIHPRGMLGKHLSEEQKKRLSEYWTGRKRPNRCGENHWNWKGGIKINQNPISYLKNQEKIAGRPKPNQCELCGRKGYIVFDHNHKTGKFRGWLCQKCNITLGNVQENCELLNSMIDYIKKNNM